VVKEDAKVVGGTEAELLVDIIAAAEVRADTPTPWVGVKVRPGDRTVREDGGSCRLVGKGMPLGPVLAALFGL
jgi:hypothetical protein